MLPSEVGKWAAESPSAAFGQSFNFVVACCVWQHHKPITEVLMDVPALPDIESNARL
jgi:hypothetical protein